MTGTAHRVIGVYGHAFLARRGAGTPIRATTSWTNGAPLPSAQRSPRLQRGMRGVLGQLTALN